MTAVENYLNYYAIFPIRSFYSWAIGALGWLFSYNSREPKKQDDFEPPEFNGLTYVEREDKTRELSQYLRENKLTAIVACYGIGGIGKTELAIRYAHQHGKDKTIWFNAEATLTDAIEAFLIIQKEIIPTAKLKIPELEKKFKEWRSAHPEMLCIFDNAITYKDLHGWVKGGHQGAKILITTRDPDFGGAVIPKVEVDVLTVEKALELFMKYTQRKWANETEKNWASSLAEELSCLPLAIAQAAAYIRTYNQSYEHFFRKFMGYSIELVNGRPNDNKIEEDTLYLYLVRDIPNYICKAQGILKSGVINNMEYPADTSEMHSEIPPDFFNELVDAMKNGVNLGQKCEQVILKITSQRGHIQYARNKQKYLTQNSDLLAIRHAPVWVMIDLNWEKLEEKEKSLLAYCVCLAPEKIPAVLLQRVLGIPEREFLSSLEKLKQIGLLQPDGNDHYKIHRLFREMIQIKIGLNSFGDKLINIVPAIRGMFEKAREEKSKVARSILPHIQAISELLAKYDFNFQSIPDKVLDEISTLYEQCHFWNYTASGKAIESIYIGIRFAILLLENSWTQEVALSQLIANSKKLAYDTNPAFGNESFRSNLGIDHLNATLEQRELLLTLLRRVQEIFKKEPQRFTDIDHALLTINLNFSKVNKDEEEDCASFEEKILKFQYAQNFLVSKGVAKNSVFIILSNVDLGLAYRVLALKLKDVAVTNSLDCLKKSRKILERVIEDMETHKIRGDHPLYADARLELAISLKELAKIIANKESENALTKECLEKAEKLYNEAYPVLETVLDSSSYALKRYKSLFKPTPSYLHSLGVQTTMNEHLSLSKNWKYSRNEIDGSPNSYERR